MNVPDTMNPAVCGAIAQLAPVFMVLLVAERIVFTTDDGDNGVQFEALALAVGRVFVDFTLAMLGAVLTIAALYGIEAGGFSGGSADAMWRLTILLVAAVLTRWLLLSTPLSQLFAFATRTLAQVVAVLSEGLAVLLSGIPLAVSRVVLAVVEALGQFILGVVSIGTAGRSANRVSVRRRRRHRGPRH